MKVLFDQGTPAPLRRALVNCEVETAFERGWSTQHNGALIAAAESAGFDVFVSTDRNLEYQQNLSGRALSIVVLLTTSWPRIQRQLEGIAAAVETAQPGGYAEISVE